MEFHNDVFSIIVKDYEKSFPDISKSIFVAPNIPDKKLNGAIKGITKNKVAPNKVLLVLDQTLFGSATDGILSTIDTFYYNGGLLGECFSVKYNEITDVVYERQITKDNKGKEKVQEKFVIKTQDAEYEITSSTGLSYRSLKHWLLAIRDASILEKESKVSSEESNNKISRQTLENMPVEIQMAYLKLIINFLFSDDNKIDEQEWGELYSLIARLKISKENRHDLILYQSKLENNETLIQIMCTNLDELAKLEITFSLAKDLINIHMKTKGDDFTQSKFIMDYAKQNEITIEQLELFKESIENDKKIYDDDIDDKGLENNFSMIASSAATVGVPLAALYFSGSVIGLGATGITSGLAALGLGGIFGLSSMATGIGAVVLLGVGANKGIKHLTGQNEVEKRKRKEALLLAVNKHLQKSINLIMEDINFMMWELSEALNKGLMLEEEVRQGNETILKLADCVKTMTGGGQQLNADSQFAELKALCQRLPRKLNIERLQAITSEPTQQEYYAQVLQYYTQKEIKETNGKVTVQYELNENLSRDEASYLVKILEMLQYFSASSVAKQGMNSITGIFGK